MIHAFNTIIHELIQHWHSGSHPDGLYKLFIFQIGPNRPQNKDFYDIADKLWLICGQN